MATRSLTSVSVTVGTSSTAVFAANPARRAIWFSGSSANAVSLGFGGAALLHNGITIVNAVLPRKLTWQDIGDALYGTVTAIAAAEVPVGFAELTEAA